jgi:hypothetical protein
MLDFTGKSTIVDSEALFFMSNSWKTSKLAYA